MLGENKGRTVCRPNARKVSSFSGSMRRRIRVQLANAGREGTAPVGGGSRRNFLSSSISTPPALLPTNGDARAKRARDYSNLLERFLLLLQSPRTPTGRFIRFVLMFSFSLLYDGDI